MENDSDRTIVNTGRMPLFGAAATTTTGMNGNYSDMGPSANVLPIGSRLGEFEILDLIGEGGFGIVYLALDHSLGRHVALKEYMPSGMASRTRNLEVTVKSQHHVDTFTAGLKSFINEARLLAQFDSKSLVKVYRFWEANGTAYMVMPFYAGITLKQALKEQRIVPTENWIKAMLGNLLEAVETIHRVQCFHRDIAPDNILLLNEDGSPLLLDFGAARRVIGDRTQGPTVILKPGFAPIEQYADIGGLRQGAWTDIYALGAVIYYLISGKAPPPAVARIVNDEMVPAQEIGKGRYSEPFLAAIDRALAIKPAGRFQSIQELRRALNIHDPVPRTSPDGSTAAGGPFGPTPSFTPNYAAAGGAMQVNNFGETNTAWLNKPMPEKTAFQNPAPEKKGSNWTVTALIASVLGVAGISYWWLSLTESENADRVVTAESRNAPPQDLAALSENPSATDNATLPDVPPTTVEDSTLKKNSAIPDSPSNGTATNPPANNNTIAEQQAPEPAAAAEVQTPERRAALEKTPPSRPKPAPAPIRGTAEDELWRIASTSDKPSAYEFYLNEYPKGRYAAAAKAKLALNKPQAAAAKPAPAPVEQNQPKKVKPAPQANASAAQPLSPDKPVAAALSEDSRPQTIVRDAEEELWKLAVNSNNASDYEAYLGKYPNGKNAVAAKEKLASLRPPEKIERVPEILPKDLPPLITPKQQKDETLPMEKVEPKPPPSQAKRVIEFNDQTMSGDFSIDSVTGAVSGIGKVVWKNGDEFEGTLVKGSKEGKGKFSWSNGTRYNGDWMKDIPNGRGTFIFPNGDRYNGEVKNGKPEGTGSFIFPNGDRYDGEVKNGKPEGTGTMKFRNGDTHQGSWLMGKSNGYGRYTWASGGYWEGEFDNGRKTENGKTVRAETMPQAVP